MELFSQPIRQAIDEAKRIVAQHDGIHQLHSDVAALIFMEKCASNGAQIDEGEVERILNRMRRAAATGQWSEA